jgi:hypothetical protein
MKELDGVIIGTWEMKKFVRDDGMKEITLPERLKRRLRCSVMAKTRDTVTEIRD